MKLCWYNWCVAVGLALSLSTHHHPCRRVQHNQDGGLVTIKWHRVRGCFLFKNAATSSLNFVHNMARLCALMQSCFVHQLGCYVHQCGYFLCTDLGENSAGCGTNATCFVNQCSCTLCTNCQHSWVLCTKVAIFCALNWLSFVHQHGRVMCTNAATFCASIWP